MNYVHFFKFQWNITFKGSINITVFYAIIGNTLLIYRDIYAMNSIVHKYVKMRFLFSLKDSVIYSTIRRIRIIIID